jgi:hypothetical protein
VRVRDGVRACEGRRAGVALVVVRACATALRARARRARARRARARAISYLRRRKGGSLGGVGSRDPGVTSREGAERTRIGVCVCVCVCVLQRRLPHEIRQGRW